MAYQSSTVGSTAANPPVLVSQGMASTGLGSTSQSTAGRMGIPKEWIYKSTHTRATAAGSNFFSDGAALGMELGDRVLVMSSTAASATVLMSQHTVRAVSSTGGVGISIGLLVSSSS